MKTLPENHLKHSSDVIMLLRLPLTIVVVCIHQFGTPMWSIFAVPCFFMISGYLFFLNLSEFGWDDYKRKISKRFRSLFIPHIIWCTLYTLFYCAVHSKNMLTFLKQKGWLHIYYDTDVWNSGDNLFAFSQTAYFPILGVTWYLRDLMICVILSPFIYGLTKKLGVYWLGVLMVLWILRPFEVNLHGITIGALLFFSCGAYFSLQKKNLVKPSHIVGTSAVALSLAFIGLDYVWGMNRPLKCVYIIISSLSVFYLGYLYLYKAEKRFSSFFVESSFIIFISHQFYLPIYGSLCQKMLPEEPWVFHLFISLVMTVTTGFFLFLILKKYVPNVLKILCGGR